MKIHRYDMGYGIGVLAAVLALMLLWPGLWKNLLVANGFLPHGHCYLWKPSLVWLHIISDTLIGLAYVAISGTLAYLVYKSRQDIPFHWMFLLFGTFIVACGSTHFMEVWTLWTPTYWLAGELKLITAVASVTTAVILPSLVPQVLGLVEDAKISQERKLKLEVANQELEELAHKLKELDRLKTQFFANVSHELRTPLALILGPTEKLLASDKLTQEQHNNLKVVRRNAQTLLKHVNNLLDVSKLEAGKMSVNYTQVDLAHLVKLTAAHFETLAQECHISFAIDTPESVPAQVDAEKLQRICFNLLSNAFKFTPNSGSIKCRVEVCWGGEEEKVKSQKSKVKINTPPLPCAPAPISARITVEDSGVGVPLELREVIFEPFRQGEQEASRKFGGTGLGLAIVKEFVELHGGAIAVDEAALGGARFTVELPLLAPADVEVESAIALSPDNINSELASVILAELRSPEINVVKDYLTVPSTQPRVLVVEDNPEMNRFIADTLASDYNIVTALNGQEGLELALKLHPDAILSDVMMPQMTGDRMVRQIRLQRELNAVPIVLLTAKADDDLRVQMLREGVQDYLMKPFSAEELKARVANQIAMKRAKEILQQELGSVTENLALLAEEVRIRQRELQTTLAALQESEQRFRQLAEHIREIFWLFDTKNSKILYISPRYEQIWSLSCQSMYEQPKSFLDIVYPEDKQQVLLAFEKQLRGEHLEVEYRIVQRNGSIRWIWARAFPIEDEWGEVYRIAGIAEDITDRKQAEIVLQNFASELEIAIAQRTDELALSNALLQEKIAEIQAEKEALRRSEERFRSYFELPLIGIAITSEEKGWLQVNDKLCDIFGYSRQELSQMTWVEITHPDDLAADIDNFNQILAGERESYTIDKRFIRKDGEVIHADIATQCVRCADGSTDYFVLLVQDITDRVRALLKLRLLESVVVNANDAIVITEAEPIEEPGPRILYVNAAFTRMTGYTLQEVVGKTPRILQGPQSDRATLNQLREAIQNWQPGVFELMNYRKDGSQFWVELSLVPVADEMGCYTHWIAIERDITQRKLSEEALYRREREFKTLVENSPDIILRSDREMRYLYVNPVVQTLTGTPTENFIGKNFREMGSPEELCQLWETTLTKVFESGVEQTIQFVCPTAMGVRTYQSRVVPEPNKKGAIESALAVIRDITELKEAEEERAQRIREQAARVLAEAQQRRFAFLAEASMVLASSFDYETTLAQVARLALPYLADWCIFYIVGEEGQILRLASAHSDPRQEELLQQLQSYDRLDAANPKSKIQNPKSGDPNRSHPVLEVLSTLKPAYYPELSYDQIQQCASNAEDLQILEALKPQSAIVVPLVTQGRILGTLEFVYAESGRRYSWEELALAEELATRAALAVDNSRTHREAQEANRLKDEFLAILSHELRTPLHAILGWVNLLRTRKIDAITTARALETIERNARLQTQMVSDLLDVSRIIRGKLELNLSPIDPIPVLVAALDTVRPIAERQGVELKCVFNAVGEVAADADRLQQIVWNLLSNAIKFTPKGGLVEIKLEKLQMADLKLQNENKNAVFNLQSEMSNLKLNRSEMLNIKSEISYAKITVTDTGKGISPGFLPYVFDRFRQESNLHQGDAHSSLTRSQVGLGLGLAIVRHLVELHGGTVSADSAGEGQGATFTVKLPARG
ncbi:PAS domain S-box protein [Aerosakkonema funiforme]|uniref:PAS domain S-box protein n=1 Tax=Aerosakkonema funiforme TaxID=1246630 RepID=UPI0035B6EF91